ncbi:MAG: DUF2911 domain-containing protein [Luteitalea sp.]|nr:DUF2911 domain-containing protein [Luteitalea sp.]
MCATKRRSSAPSSRARRSVRRSYDGSSTINPREVTSMLVNTRFATALLVGSLALASAPAAAQEVEEVHPGKGGSPHEAHTWTVGDATIKITYGRPNLKGRDLDELVSESAPDGPVWRTGADEATTLDVSQGLKIGDLSVPAGTYTLYTLPGESDWQLVVSKQTGQWGTEYDEGQDLGRSPMTKETLSEPVEQLTFKVDETDAGGTLAIEWGTTRVSAPFTVGQ